MASVSGSSSVSSALGITGKGIGGLATGLDTDSLVAALTAGTKAKIAKQGQQKQLLNWKINAYRTMSTALNAFQSKTLKIGASGTNTNITSANFFNTFKSTSSSDKVSVSTTASSMTGNFTIDKVNQLATSESFSSVNKLSSTLNLDLSNAKAGDFKGQTLKLDVDGFTTKSIKLDDLENAFDASGNLDVDKFQSTLQNLINSAYKSTSLVTVGKDASTGNLILDSGSAKITINTDNEALGVYEGDTNRVDVYSTLGSLDAFKNVQGDVLTFNINGVDISVNKNDTISSLMSKVNNSGAEVRMDYNKANDRFTLTSKQTGANSAIEMRDVHGNLLNEIFGAQSGNGIGSGSLTTGNSITSLDLNTIDSMTQAQKKELANSIKGASFDLTINGVTKTVKLDTVLGMNSTMLENGDYTSQHVYNAINKGIQNAFYESGVTFSKDKDGHTVVKSSQDEAFSVDIGSELGKIIGLTGKASNVVSDYDTTTLSQIKNGKAIGSGTLTINDKEIEYDQNTTLQELLDKVNSALGEGSAGIKDGKLYINSSSDKVTITDTDADGNLKTDGTGLLKNMFGINGGEVKTKDSEYGYWEEGTEQKLRVYEEDVFDTDGETLLHKAGDAILDEDGNEQYDTVPTRTFVSTFNEGKNAIYEINGVRMESSSNSISYNNVNITLNDISDEAIKIGVQSDPEDVVKRLQDWMDDYNALVFTINSALNEGKNSEYAPLTDEQKADMTEDQIKTWETEAKKGLLRNDQTLRNILNEMRNVFYEKVESAGISLYDIGIVTKSGVSDPNEAGQLEFDKNVTGGGEERLRQMLTNNPDKVRMLFIDPDNGIGAKLNDIIKRAANESSVDRGTLVRIAGTEKLTGDNTSQLKDKISAIDKYVTALKSRYESEYNRFWKKFSALETSVNKMNTQSSWLQSQ